MIARWRVWTGWARPGMEPDWTQEGSDYATEARATAAADALGAHGRLVRVTRVDLRAVHVLATVPSTWAGCSWQVVIEGVGAPQWVRLEQGKRVRVAFRPRSFVGHHWWAHGPDNGLRRADGTYQPGSERVGKGSGVLACLRALGWDVVVVP